MSWKLYLLGIDVDAKFRSRKWQLTVGVFLVSGAALFFGRLTGGEWTTIATVLVGAYNFANVLEAKWTHESLSRQQL